MSRSSDRLRSPGEGPRQRGPRHQETTMPTPMSTAKPDIVTPERWRAAREALLVQEKAHTRARDALAAERRRMPMIRVEKDYRFTAPGGGDATLPELFDGSRQLVVYRFFMDPDMDVYPKRGCPGCSMYADQLGNLLHLRERAPASSSSVAASRSTCSATASTWAGSSPGTRCATTSTPTTTSRSGTARTCSCATATRSTARTSSTPVATRRSARPGASSTSPRTAARRSGRTPPRTGRRPRPTPGAAGTTSTTTRSDVLAHVAGVPVEEALQAAPALLAAVTMIAGYVWATVASPRR